MHGIRPGDRSAQAVLFALVILIATILLVSCSDETPPTKMPTAESPIIAPTAVSDPEEVLSSEAAATQPPATPTDMPPTATPEPMAAQVNGNPIFLVDFNKEVARFQQAQIELGLVTDGEGSDFTEVVLEALIETEIINQAAEKSGMVMTDQMVSERIEELKQASGGEESFFSWLQANQWTEEEFHQALKTEMVVEQMVRFVTTDVPYAVEQVHARYLQVDDAEMAQSLLEQARNGADFEGLAQQNSLDRITGEDGGDLGFFARGSLLVPEVEAAAFALEPGQLSDVVSAPKADGSGTVYYLVQMIERDPQREITANLRSLLLQEKFETWLAEQWNLADVERFVGDNQ